MNTTMKTQVYAGEPEYDKNFWDVMRGKEHRIDKIAKGRNSQTDTYAVPAHAKRRTGQKDYCLW